MFVKTSFTKENVDYFLKELAKEFRKRNGSKTPAEIILIGGASILGNPSTQSGDSPSAIATQIHIVYFSSCRLILSRLFTNPLNKLPGTSRQRNNLLIRHLPGKHILHNLRLFFLFSF